MLFKVILASVTLGLIAGWFFKNDLLDYGRAWYLGVTLPKYRVAMDRDIAISIQNEIVLKADIYRPKQQGKYPALILRTPYGKRNHEHGYAQIARFFAGQGFVFIVQDVRGKGASQELFYPHKNEAFDGSETISWAIQQPWSDGQIGLFGFSYPGVAAWQAAMKTTKAICTIIPWFSSSHPYATWYDKGVPYLKQLLFWMCNYGGSASTKSISHGSVDAALAHSFEWNALDTNLTDQGIPAYRDFLAHPEFDDYWLGFSPPIVEVDHDLPILLGSGWYDQFLKPTIDDFKTLRQASQGSKKSESRIVIGPWTHNPTEGIRALHLNSDAKFLRQFSIMLAWCQKWMCQNSSLKLDPVSYYLMGRNQWKTAEDWPPHEAKPIKFYLSSSEKMLKETLPERGKTALIFNPREFVSSIGGRMIFSNGKEGPQDQSFLTKREDVLFWTSDSLKQPLAIVGAPLLHLYLSETPPSFDLSVKLIDIFPEGKMQLITEGYSRIENPKGDSLFPMDIALVDTAYEVPLNHRLQVAVTHSDFPGHEPNPKVMQNSKASLSISTGIEHPSHFKVLVLP